MTRIRSTALAVVLALLGVFAVGCVPTAPANSNAVLGIDIYNGNADSYNFAEVKAEGVSFEVAKASQGWIGGPGGWADWTFVNATARARAAGLLTGGYHWLLRSNGPAQADNFYNSLRAAGGPNGMLAAVDVEQNVWDQSLNPDAATLSAFLAEWDRISGGHPIIIYSAEWYWGAYMGEPRQFANRPLWWAGYTSAGGPISASVNSVTPGYFAPFGGFSSYLIRQWTSSAIVDGKGSDADVYYGTPQSLLAYAYPPALQAGPSGPTSVTPPSVSAKLHRFDLEPQIGPGSTGQAVKDFQMAVNAIEKRHYLNVDGVDGPSTVAAAKALQAFFRFPGGVDGVIGRLSWPKVAALVTSAGS